MTHRRGQIPLSVWAAHEEDLLSMKETREFEAFLGEYAIALNNYQTAIQLCCETLGSRAHMVPVILPVTASLEAFTGVLLSGALPVVLDVDPGTLHVRVDQLQECLEELGEAAVLFERIGGYDVPESLMELVQDLPTIVAVRRPPHDCFDQLNLQGSFNVFDLRDVVGSGAVVYHMSVEGRAALRQLSAGILGHRAWLPPLMASEALMKLRYELGPRERAYHNVIEGFVTELYSRDPCGIIPWDSADLSGLALFTVPNAAKIKQHLAKHGLPSMVLGFPLHKMPAVRVRLSETSEYPNADMIANKIIGIPTHAYIDDPKVIEEYVDLMIEAIDDREGRSTPIEADSQE